MFCPNPPGPTGPIFWSPDDVVQGNAASSVKTITRFGILLGGVEQGAIDGVNLGPAGHQLDSEIFSFGRFALRIVLGILFVAIIKLNILVSNLDGIVKRLIL